MKVDFECFSPFPWIGKVWARLQWIFECFNRTIITADTVPHQKYWAFPYGQHLLACAFQPKKREEKLFCSASTSWNSIVLTVPDIWFSTKHPVQGLWVLTRINSSYSEFGRGGPSTSEYCLCARPLLSYLTRWMGC